ncbi:MAG: alkaline phosphatase PhoX [Pseudomonadota bacterium]
MTSTRRQFIRNAMAMAAAAPAYSALSACATRATQMTRSGPRMIADPEGLLDLPPGFKYQRLSEIGQIMSDGFRVPGAHDGMGAFAIDGDPDRCVLVRNHELDLDETANGPFGAGKGLPNGLDRNAVFDVAPNGDPVAGGTTTLIYNTRTRELEQSFLSMVGTERNCSGGVTPWGSWITCEETETAPNRLASQYHGYAFEVPATARSLVPARPLKAMGRFKREGAAIDPRTGIVYQTEDSGTGLLYRFIPDAYGELHRGGRLQALAIVDMPSADTRNWSESGSRFSVGQTVLTRWVDLDDVEAFETRLQERGYALGAARFARGEGIAWAMDPSGSAAYFACTNGGAAKAGQIWRYTPSPYEGTPQETNVPGQLTLHYESPSRTEMDMCDNLVASPWGHLIVCEDGSDDDYLRGVAPNGTVYDIACSPSSELAGACFSPDGQTLFVNVQKSGVTAAITGPWESLIVASERANFTRLKRMGHKHFSS